MSWFDGEHGWETEAGPSGSAFFCLKTASQCPEALAVAPGWTGSTSETAGKETSCIAAALG
jgi:hypothetical protein